MHAFISHQMLFRTPICRRSSFPKESQSICIKLWVAAKKGKGQHIELSHQDDQKVAAATQ